MFLCQGYASLSSNTPLEPFRFDRRDPGRTDVRIDIDYCGVCHSDLHVARNDWQDTTYPIVPGHEIVGRVTEVGSGVTKFKVGDLAGVGTRVDSCRTCSSCRRGLEQFCEIGAVSTYNSVDRHTGRKTYGGYSQAIVVDENFVLTLPANLDPATVAPLLCAGITTYSPLMHWKVGPGQKVGIVGLGGLGHMAVKFAHALGADVTLFTTSPGKRDDARRLGADEVIVSNNLSEFESHRDSFDFILDTVAVDHDVNAYVKLLKLDGTMTQIGAPKSPLAIDALTLMSRRRSFAGSQVGGIAETQEMLQFCGKHGIAADVEIIAIQQIEHAFKRMLKSDVKYRFVIDMKSLK
ncbi:NAD(P)-dependent alcohol dehydrogenase [Mesorhizobium sp. M2A.F.Ca.ET.067.02.1.1]|uniref:NAD(P)-dependent alcohol dehydrogenase n=1 Tax=Mesorhizobium sp. M2A.F.Ca.ET.067.02.1.1 TaxID=2496749 RepID=UPI000FD49818|nr:NAD(P)-dependent alcohol dehydrogenase [Mesorhizobium sp. M2A.F.Ca.ET.067.02.1.1]RUW73021.1 NAD(P)-dependent alcohol dehydrogenase [Mesorhizobium sp. M2A.F.Ca.ET.067.02.1.1]TIU58566.1 MAG: NAD(P)-dependent alcohol dehydrogenase [Mesorhizobium sp.]